MERKSFRAALATAAGALAIALVAGAAARQPDAALVKRGERLVTVGGCTDCHTPMKFDAKLGMPVPDLSRRLAGHPAGAPGPAGTLGPQDALLVGPTFTSFRTALGLSYATNLTPHATGLGTWKEADFIRTMRTGRHLGEGRPIMPPMPWTNLAAIPDEDLRAMFAYLRTLPPVDNATPAAELAPGADALLEKQNAAMRGKPAG